MTDPQSPDIRNSSAPPAGFQVMVKPIGPACNLACRYCYYLEKAQLYPDNETYRMPDAVLESFTRQYIAAHKGPEIPFAWQGGEPLLLGLGFFKRAVALQRQYCPPGQRVTNALQTNGTLLDPEWCAFFREHGFLIGLSIDGPRQLHDRYRLDRGGKPTFDRALRGLQMLRQHGVEFNTLTVVNRHNARRPLDVYRFLRDQGSPFMQFIPLVERVGERKGQLASAPDLTRPDESPVAEWSVEPLAFGEFLCAVFDEWIRNDVGRVYVQIFEVQLGLHMGLPSSLCVFSETCGRGLILEHNGDLYACDHFVYPAHNLGNIMKQPLLELVALPQQIQFGRDKRDKLPQCCRECDVLFACRGECPKHRFVTTRDGEPGWNYLCPGYKRFLHHIRPYMDMLGDLLRANRPADNIMPMLARRDRAAKKPR
jgi:uncharacterized protein